MSNQANILNDAISGMRKTYTHRFGGYFTHNSAILFQYGFMILEFPLLLSYLDFYSMQSFCRLPYTSIEYFIIIFVVTSVLAVSYHRHYALECF